MARDRYGEEVEGGATPARRPAPPLRWETVPAGTQPSICTGHRRPGGTCRAEVFWIERAKIRKGKPVPGQKVRLPVDCDVVGGSRPDSFTEGKGVSHHTTCPDAKQF